MVAGMIADATPSTAIRLMQGLNYCHRECREGLANRVAGQYPQHGLTEPWLRFCLALS